MAKTKVNWANDDPMSDRAATVKSQGGFKGAKFPKTDFSDGKVRQEINKFYTPHPGKVKK